MANSVHYNGFKLMTNPNPPIVSNTGCHQAVNALKGYAYQLYATALAWIALGPEEILYVEVAEDYAVATKRALNGVQVKDTEGSGTITLNSIPVINAINGFVEIVNSNPERQVSLEYLTTSRVGVEKCKEHRFDDKGGIEYWSAASIAADVRPLRKRLLSLQLSKNAKSFIETRDDSQLRDDLIRRIHWHCGRPSRESLKKCLEDALILHGESKNVDAQPSSETAGAVMEYLLNIASTKGRRQVSRADFLRLFDEQTRVPVPRDVYEKLVRFFIHKHGKTPVEVSSAPSILMPVAPIPNADPLAPRNSQVNQIINQIRKHQIVWLHAGVGRGKTQFARRIALDSGNTWLMARFYDLKPAEIPDRLSRLAAELNRTRPHGVILDGLNEISAAGMGEALARLVATAKRTGTALIVTAHHKLSASLCAVTGIPQSVVYEIENLREADIKELVQAYGASPQRWARYLWIASAGGHPQLAHALAMSLNAKRWPKSELITLPSLLGKNDDVQQTHTEIRRRLANELSDDQRRLLYRVGIILGSFDRSMALKLGSLSPAIAFPGESFDCLLGPWINQIGVDEFRTSPLVRQAGLKTLDPSEVKTLHGEIARYWFSTDTIRADQFDAIMFHAINGEEHGVLMKLFYATMTAPPEKTTALANSTSLSLLWTTERPIYCSDINISVPLRIQQCVLLLSAGKYDKFRKAWTALDREFSMIDNVDAAASAQLAAYCKVCSHPAFGSVDHNFISSLLRLRSIFNSSGEPQYLSTTSKLSHQGQPIRPVPFLFAFQLFHIDSSSTLVKVFRHIADLSQDDREFLFGIFEHPDFTKQSCFRSVWVREMASESPEVNTIADNYRLIAKLCVEFGDADFAAESFVQRAVIFDEILNDQYRASRELKEAIDILGERTDLNRARARVLFHGDKYGEALKLLRPILDSKELSNPVERAYMHREAAICFADQGEWGNAARYFAKAETFAEHWPHDDMKIMAVGLGADASVAHWQAGNKNRAIRRMLGVLGRLQQVDPLAGLRASACHSLIGHTIEWMRQKCRQQWEKNSVTRLEMIPGLNSNPTPHKDLENRPLIAFEFLYYRLAEIDIKCGTSVGVTDILLEHLPDEKAILLGEFSLVNTRWRYAFESLDADCFQVCSTRMVDVFNAKMMLDAGAVASLENLRKPMRGRIAKLSGDSFKRRRECVLLDVLVFLVRASLAGEFDTVNTFLEKDLGSDRPILDPEVLASFRKGKAMRPVVCEVAAAVGLFIKVRMHKKILTVDELFVVGLGLFNISRHAILASSIADEFLSWNVKSWQRAVEEQSFRFVTPREARIAITTQISNISCGWKGLAELLLCMRAYVGIPLSSAVVRALREA